MRRIHIGLVAGIALLMVAVWLWGCAAPKNAAGPVSKQKLTDGVYEGTYAQLPNVATVRVTIKDGKIAAVQVVSHVTLKGKKAEIPIAQRIVESQSTKVDAVTGATNSSQTLMKAAQIAIEKAYPK